MLALKRGVKFFTRQSRDETDCSSCIRQPNDLSDKKSIFQQIPLVIRWRIYSHLLLDENVCSVSETSTLGPNYSTALSRVCEQISHESLEYFQHENLFLLLETNLDSEFVTSCREAMPLIPYPTKPGFKIPPFACRISYDDVYQRSSKLFIFAAWNLPNLITMINIEHALPDYYAHSVELSVSFASGTYNPKVIHQIITDFKALHPSPAHKHRNLNFEIRHLSPELTTEIETAFARRPGLSPALVVQLTLRARDMAHDLIERSSYPGARGACAIRTFAVARLQLQGSRLLREKTAALAVDTHLDMALLEALDGRHDEAVWRAEKAWEMAFVGDNPLGWFAELKFSLGVALVGAGRYEDAIGALTHACAFETDNEIMRTMLESLKVLVAELKRENEEEDSREVYQVEGSLKSWFDRVTIERRQENGPLDHCLDREGAVSP